MNLKRRRQQLDFSIERLELVANEQLLILNDHQLRLDELRSSSIRQEVHSEQLKAQNCVKRLQNILREFENLKRKEDIQYLNEKANQFVIRINSQIEHILKEQQLFSENQDIDSNELTYQEDATKSERLENLMLEDTISDSKHRLQSVQLLRRDLIDLHAAFNKLASLTQKETTDRIDNNITVASDNIHRGAVELTSIKKAAGVPIIFAAIGTAMAGPIGMIAGFKIGALAGLGAATIGYSGGKVVQRYANPPAIEMNGTNEEQSDRIIASDS